MPADVPWKPNQTPLQKFKTLVERLSTPDEASEKSPSIDQTLNYLAMLWNFFLARRSGTSNVIRIRSLATTASISIRSKVMLRRNLSIFVLVKTSERA